MDSSDVPSADNQDAQQRFANELKEIGIVIDRPYSDLIALLTLDQLIHLYKRLYEGTMAKFCRENRLNSGNFSRFINRKRGSQLLVTALRNFLLSYIGVDQAIVEHQWTIDEIVDRLGEWSAGNEDNYRPELIFFIDGDCASTLLKILIGGVYDITTAHIFCFLSKHASLPSSTTGIRNSPYLTMIRSLTSAKDATDIALTMAATLADQLLPSGLKFVVGSEDAFAIELAMQINLRNRRSCVRLDRTTIDHLDSLLMREKANV